MPRASSNLKSVPSSSGGVTLHMLEGILHQHKMDLHAKLAALRELCVERISFDTPAQAVKIISALAEIISTDPVPETRVAAMETMERMIGLEQKAETELGKPPVDWRKVNLLLHRARRQTELDTTPVASRAGAPSPESPTPMPVRSSSAVPPPAPVPDAKPVRDADIAPAEAALLAVQEAAVSAIRQGNPPVVPPPSPAPVAAATAAPPPASAATVTPAPSPAAAPSPQPEPPIMKFLRAIAETDGEEEKIRELAGRIMARIEALTAVRPAAAPAPTLTEG